VEIAESDDTVVGKLMLVKEIVLDKEGSVEGEPVERVVSVNLAVSVFRPDDEIELEIDGDIVAESTMEIELTLDGDVVDESPKEIEMELDGLNVASGTFETVPRFESDICAV